MNKIDGDEGFVVVYWRVELHEMSTAIPPTGRRSEKRKEVARKVRSRFLPSRFRLLSPHSVEDTHSLRPFASIPLLLTHTMYLRERDCRW
jgi:hypothetical protein